MPTQHDIEVVPYGPTVVFRCKQCRADFRTVGLAFVLRHEADGTLAEYFDRVRQAHIAAPPARHLPATGFA
jgi:hypothetical protein